VSVHPGSRITIPDLLNRKGGEPIAVLTAYTAPVARLLDPHVDILLVGDSLGMVIYGLPSTLQVTLDMMIAHGRAVVSASSHAAIVVDMPFGSYQPSPADAFKSAARIMAETGCDAVKLEGGVEMAETVAFLTGRGIPVMGHVGLLPQSVNTMGGYRSRGRDSEEARRIVEGAAAIAAAGAFSIVIEGTVEPVARAVTEAVKIPTIGIGASAACDGQVLVIDDVIGLAGDFRPRLARRYLDIGPMIAEAARLYAADVRGRRFPGPENVYGLSKARA
jgi:3-methyl-2-oxobutanoate hydroxymethyltransferase